MDSSSRQSCCRWLDNQDDDCSCLNFRWRALLYVILTRLTARSTRSVGSRATCMLTLIIICCKRDGNLTRLWNWKYRWNHTRSLSKLCWMISFSHEYNNERVYFLSNRKRCKRERKSNGFSIEILSGKDLQSAIIGASIRSLNQVEHKSSTNDIKVSNNYHKKILSAFYDETFHFWK